MQVIGLTGSIAMGKSHAANMFKRFGIPVFDSDAAVHSLFRPGQALVQLIERTFGQVVDTQGGIDRTALGAKVLGDQRALIQLERLVHPAVHRAQWHFLQQACRQGFGRALLDIPLLFESGNPNRFDAVLVVACAPELQRQRVMRRLGMSCAKFAAINAKQMPIAEKARRADRIIRSGYDRGNTHKQVIEMLNWLDGQPARAWPGHWHK